MYRVFMVDDRVDVVEGIMKLVQWESLGCTAVGWAANGKAAYERFGEDQPDIVITDIKMPVMDGLELIELCKEKKQQIRFIVLSGYDDFVFAQRAIRLGVDEYILKPAGVGEISETLRRIVDSLEAERENNSRVLYLRQQLNQSLPLLKDEYFRFLTTAQREISLEELSERFGFLSIEISLEKLVLAVCEADYSRQPQNMTADSLQPVIDMAEGLLTEYYDCVSFRYGRDEVILLLHDRSHNRISERHLLLSLEEMKNRLREKTHMELTIGLSEQLETAADIPRAFSQARQALSYKMYMGNYGIILYEDVKKYPVQEKVDYINIEDSLIHEVRINDVKAIESLISHFFDRNRNLLPQQMKNAVREITTIVCHYAAGADNSWTGRTSEEWQEIFKRLQTVKELKDWMIHLFYDISREIKEKQTGQQKQYVEQVKYIVENNYANNVTLAAVSELIGLTPAYLSAIFKDEVGQTFTEYLVNIRIKKAKELLKTGSYKIYEVADKVGYADFRYFGEIFKKKTGLTPKEFMMGEII